MGKASVFCRLSVEAAIWSLAASAASWLFYAVVGRVASKAIFEEAGITEWKFFVLFFVFSFPIFAGILALLDEKVWRRKR